MTALGVAVVVCISVWLVLHRETLDSVSVDAFDAISAADGAKFLRCMAADEQAAYGMSAAQWTEFLRQYSRPFVSNWIHVKEPTKEYAKESSAK